ncbi:TPA: PAAR domain-containing protein [Salmonella enterica]|uniref:PAAR domain-containing protein n=8 Tax=Gammaproteobacteria TaxID=1236 RepID=C6G9T2_ECOLX|nr:MULTISPECIES: PAAR domain-containing protein [Gammaproteobacteria]ACN66862.1 conserved hypothetical protein [Escherichia coli]ACN67013.1 conserved hypothetical protein [Aeromonas hydrophila]ECE0367624.1 PAAR domain-containing protein [Salmonella enterica subsp. enterica]EDI3226250.1 PAAR domain-containing protein [Salmonella enterica subsp. enterica serovar Newport]EDR7498362.1 PAAR domain-containing protein [Salmonella enterica subsp. enterica serovar Kiambu]EDW8206980.1 PAAR domain-conta
MRNVARKGDPTSTGGMIQEGDSSWLSEGSPTTYIGMIATCPACKVGQGPIVAVGPRSIIGPGGPVALQGDYVACGCPSMSNVILPAQGTTVGDNMGPRAKTASTPVEPPASTLADSQPASALADSVTTPLVPKPLPLVDLLETRIGVFFDGTQNNMHNSKFREQCERASDAVCSSIEKLIGAGTSYDNGLTNVARLHNAYTGKAIYIEGIGTQSGLADDTKGLALGIGGTGVIMKAQMGLDQLTAHVQSLPPGSVVVDVFGFSRGAAAARHFINKLLALNLGRPLRVGFVGLFDTVAAIGSAADGLDTSDDNNLGVSLYLAPGCADQVVQLTAHHEYRVNFALNSISSIHREIPLYGAHSDIGGGYLAGEERIPIARPYEVTMMVGDQEALKAFKSEASKRYYEAQKVYQAYLATPSQLKDELHQYSIPTPSGGRTGYIANTVMTRYVKPELQLLAGHLMRQLAAESGVPILELTETIPDELAAIFTAYQAAATTGGLPTLTPEQEHLIMTQYAHCSDSWVTSAGIFVNAPAPSRIRRVYQQQQGK